MDKLTKGWVGYLRNNARQQEAQRTSEQALVKDTFLCQCGLQVSNDLEGFRNHVEEDREKHASLDTNDAINETFKTLSAKSQNR